MVQYQYRYQRYYHQLKKAGELRRYQQEEEDNNNNKVGNNNNNKYRWKIIMSCYTKLLFLFFFSLISFSFILAPQYLYSFGIENEACSSISNGTICCDRTAFRTDICIMKGDIRTNSASSSIFLINSASITAKNEPTDKTQYEKIKPYTRKWEKNVMDTVQELNLKSKNRVGQPPCDVYHDVPAVFFSTGGYTGNVYHDFNDGILPLYITSQHFDKNVVFVIVEYHEWWIMKYGDITPRLSNYPVIDFNGDNRTHCFPEAIVGLRIHNDLAIDRLSMKGNKTIVDFRNMLDGAYWPRIRDLFLDEEREFQELAFRPRISYRGGRRPKVVILSRNGSRAIENEDNLIRTVESFGFEVEILKPDQTTELAKVYRTLNSSDVMIGVHGAAMTYFLFMRPGSVFIQIIPLGTVWAADTYYGEPARKLGLKYIGYKILPRESSLFDSYDENDHVLIDPDSVTQKGWEFTKKVYLDGQNVRLDLERFRKHLIRAYRYSKSRIAIRRRAVIRKFL